MTDEEKAEEYVENKHYCNQSECIQGNGRDCDFCYREESKRAYLDGLAEGKPKWHDLRKDPNDLPKENGDYYVCFEDMRQTVLYWNDDYWFFINNPIAWCELPKFEGS